MMYQNYKGRKVIWENKNQHYKNVAFAFLFVAFALIMKGKLPPVLFWATVIFFGGMGIFALFWLWNPRHLFVTPDSKLGMEIMDELDREKQEDLGAFSYTNDGFYYENNKEKNFYKWSDIETVFAHEEEISYDQMVLDLFMNNGDLLELAEENPGWYQFKNRLSANVRLQPFVWNREEPDYDPYRSLLYDKKGRTLEEAEAACYPD